MRKTLKKLASIVAALMLSSTASAIGMGGINVDSALGQPLKADIELVAISKAEKEGLVARLASPEAYKSAGLEYPYGNKFKFQIETRASGQQYIRVSSAQPVNDPFVSLLVELAWSSGRLSREYTFLLDPPGYVAEQPVKATIQAVAPVVQPTSAVPSIPVEAAKPVEQAAPPAEAAVSAVPSVPAEVAKPVEQAAPTEVAAKQPEPVAPVEAAAKPVAPAEAEKPAEQAAEVTTKPVAAPAKLEEQVATEAAAKPEEAPAEVAAKPAEQAVSAVAEVKPAEAAKPAETGKPAEQAAAVESATAKDWLAVRRNDTMYKIAEQYKQTDVSLERMLVAIYRINADQFEGKNMNRIKVGKILHLPSQQEIANVSQADAEKEIHAQAADWNAYRQKLASAATVSVQSQPAQQVATGKISSSIADMAPVAKESAKEVLKLSKGEAPGDQVGTGAGGKAMLVQEKKNAAQENAIASSKEIKEGQERAALLEKNIKDMQRLAQLKAEAAALAQPPKATASAAAAASVVAATSAVAAAKPASAVKAAPPAQVKAKPQPKPEPSLVDQILDEPLYLAGGAAALLALAGAGLVAVRRRKAVRPAPEKDVGEKTGRLAVPAEAPSAGDFTSSAATQTLNVSDADTVDPISEADLFLNFGRDVQAEEILKDALKATPQNHQIHLKLLGIYANRKDTKSFAEIALQLKDSGDQEAWQQAMAMGVKLEPDNPLYGGAGSFEDTGSATTQVKAFNAAMFEQPEAPKAPAAAVLDFDLGAGGGEAAAPAAAPESSFADESQKTTVLQPEEKAAAASMGMDFDITAAAAPQAEPAEETATISLAEGLDFDITGASAAVPPAKPEEPSKPEEEAGMAFMLDFPVETPAASPVPAASPTTAAPTAPVDFADISLNFDSSEVPAVPAAGSKDEHWQEVATKLDLAKAYQEMGDVGGAREILEEVLREGDAEQRDAAQNILNQL